MLKNFLRRRSCAKIICVHFGAQQRFGALLCDEAIPNRLRVLWHEPWNYRNRTNIVDRGEFGHLRDFCSFWTRELHLNSSYGLGILRQPFRTMSSRKFGSKINVGMSRIFLKICYFFGLLEIFGVNSDIFD